MTTDVEKRWAIEQHWAASEAGDVELERRLYGEDAILDYPSPASASSVADHRRAAKRQPRTPPLQTREGARHRFGCGSECVITFNGAPSISVSIMEFANGLVTQETQYFADPFEAPSARAPRPAARPRKLTCLPLFERRSTPSAQRSWKPLSVASVKSPLVATKSPHPSGRRSALVDRR